MCSRHPRLTPTEVPSDWLLTGKETVAATGTSGVRVCQHWDPCCTHSRKFSFQPNPLVGDEKAEEKQTYVSVHVLQLPVHPVSARSLPHARSLLDASSGTNARADGGCWSAGLQLQLLQWNLPLTATSNHPPASCHVTVEWPSQRSVKHLDLLPHHMSPVAADHLETS